MMILFLGGGGYREVSGGYRQEVSVRGQLLDGSAEALRVEEAASLSYKHAWVYLTRDAFHGVGLHSVNASH